MHEDVDAAGAPGEILCLGDSGQVGWNGVVRPGQPCSERIEGLGLAAAQDRSRAAVGELLGDKLADSAERDERILDALYDVFSGIEFQASLALQVHARTDPALNARLHQIVEHATVQMGAIAAEGWGADVERSPQLPTIMRVIVGTVRGLVLVADVSAPYNSDVWPAARETLLRAIEELRASSAH